MKMEMLTVSIQYEHSLRDGTCKMVVVIEIPDFQQRDSEVVFTSAPSHAHILCCGPPFEQLDPMNILIVWLRVLLDPSTFPRTELV